MSGTVDTSSLLATIFGTGAAASAGSGTNIIAALKSAEANQVKDIASEANTSNIARDIAAFRTKVAAATDPATLLKDPAVLKVLLTANGLGGQEIYPALAQKALLSDTTKPNALANQLPNAAWKSTASLYDFANKGLTVLQNPKVADTLASAYAEVAWRQSLDQRTPGLSNALTFRQGASKITSVDQILGDPTLRTVVTTALGIPQEIAFQSLGAQEKAISSQLDISQFADPKFVEKFAQRYLIAANAAAAPSAGSSLEQLAASFQGLVV